MLHPPIEDFTKARTVHALSEHYDFVIANIGASNGLLRQHFPKGSNLSSHGARELDWVAAELNDRPRKRLRFRKTGRGDR